MPAETMEQTVAASIRKQLEALVGASFVVGGERNSAIDGIVPATVVSPGSEEEIAAILRLANENDYVVVPTGGMTKQNIGAVPERIDILLPTARLNGVLHYDAGDLTLGVGAGMTIAEIQKTLAANSQFLPLDPMLSDRATIGGVLATNAQGPLRAGFGGVRDYCIGVNFVTGDGKIAKGGGKVVKNVAGYDMMKLMTGSMGTLGVITSANFKVFPLPKQTATYLCDCADLREAMMLVDRIVVSPLAPMCLELLSPRTQEYLAEQPDVRDPDLYAPLAGMKQASWQVLLRAGGSDGVLKRYRAELGSAVTRELRGKEESDLWRAISNFEEAIIARHRNAMVVNVSVNIAGVAQAYEAAEQSAVEHNLLTACIGRAGAGSLVFAFMPLGVDPPSAMQFANVASSLRGRLPKGASAVVVRCPLEAKDRFDVWGSSPNDLEIMRGVRAAMDPKKVLNRGRFIV